MSSLNLRTYAQCASLFSFLSIQEPLWNDIVMNIVLMDFSSALIWFSSASNWSMPLFKIWQLQTLKTLLPGDAITNTSWNQPID